MRLAPDTLAALRRNRLLALLDEATLTAIAGDLVLMPLRLRDMVAREGRPMRNAWFPTEGVISMLASCEGARSYIEIGTVGNEGMVGLPMFLGSNRSPGDCFAQVSGEGWRMPAAAFVAAAGEHVAFRDVLHRYTQALFVQVSQSTACNRAHSVLQRCARWLLMTDDRVAGDAFDLTQEFLGQMLGERRPAVSRVASELRGRGIIVYSRGRIAILDRRRLEATACPCYRVVRDEYDAMFGDAKARRR